MPSWSTDEVKTLISEVEVRHSIWNVYSDEYKERVNGVSLRSHRKRFLFVKLPRQPHIPGPDLVKTGIELEYFTRPRWGRGGLYVMPYLALSHCRSGVLKPPVRLRDGKPVWLRVGYVGLNSSFQHL